MRKWELSGFVANSDTARGGRSEDAMAKAKPTEAPKAGEPSIAELIADAEKHAE